jgi:hypothetical protein
LKPFPQEVQNLICSCLARETQWSEAGKPREQMGYGCACSNRLIYHCGSSLSWNPPRNDHSGLGRWWPLAHSGLCITSVTDQCASSASLHGLCCTWARPVTLFKIVPKKGSFLPFSINTAFDLSFLFFFLSFFLVSSFVFSRFIHLFSCQ